MGCKNLPRGTTDFVVRRKERTQRVAQLFRVRAGKFPGVYLLPAGSTIMDLIEAAGGMLEGHQFKSYQPGGPSSGILPAHMNDIPLDFDTLQPHGSFIGSAAVVVMSDQDRARDAALNMLRFFEDESCGQCTPCRAWDVKRQ